MKFNKAVDERAIWEIIKKELGLDGPEAQSLAHKLLPELKRSCEAALRIDRVELREELEAELKEKLRIRETKLEIREKAGGGLTREELIRILAEGITDDDGKINTQAATLLTKLEGFEAAVQDITVNIIDYSDAPDWFRVTKPEPIDA